MSPEIHERELASGVRIKSGGRPENPLPFYNIEGIRSDMGGPNLLRVLFTSQRDGFLQMTNPQTGDELSIGFASITGGAFISPVISEKIGNIALDLAMRDGHLPPGLHEMPPFPPTGDRRSRGMRIRVKEDGFIAIRNIRGDQGHGTNMDLLIESDSDAVIAISNGEIGLEMQFTSSGTMFPCIGRRLKELALILASLEDH